MTRKYILIIGSVVTIGLTLLWAFEIIKEPMVGLATGILTLLGFLFPKNGENSATDKNVNVTGDEIAGDKKVKYGKIKSDNAKIITQGQSGGQNTVTDSKN
jgi:hypothetical protein